MRRSALIVAAWAMAASSAAAADAAQTATGSDGSTVTVEARAATVTPYRNQSILYTLRCAVRGGISGLSLSDISVSDAIVQRQGKPDIHDETEHGVSVRVASFRYIVTPLRAGLLIIPAITLSGKFQAPDLSAAANPLGLKLSSGVRQAFSFFSTNGAEPFSVTSNAVRLDVRPPAAAMDPWLPLNSLKIIEDENGSHAVHVGEPMARKITLLADGAVGSQIPQPAAQADDAILKTYVDSSATGEDVDIKSGSILGWRKQGFSLIPQKPGRLLLPAIRVSWWDLGKKKRATAELPGRAIDVLPAAQAARHVPTTPIPQPAPKSFDIRALLAKARWTLVMLGGVMAVALTVLVLWRLKYRPASAMPVAGLHGRTARPRQAARASLSLLDGVRTPEQVRDFLQAYAHDHSGTSKNAALENIVAAWNPLDGALRAEVETAIEALSTALYAGAAIDIDDVKARVRHFLPLLAQGARHHGHRGESLPDLNPV